MEHYLTSTPDHLHWGLWDGRLSPVIRIASGDRVTIETLSAEPDEAFDLVSDLVEPLGCSDIPASHGAAPRLLTGPIHIEGAEPGDVLEVRVLDVRLRSDWGWNMRAPTSAARETSLDFCCRYVPLDRTRNIARLPWGRELRLSPCFGNFGVAPPANWDPRKPNEANGFSGRIDNRDLGVGCTAYFPIFVAGALFSAGHGHALLDDGAAQLSAIETALAGTFEFHIRRNLHLATPRVETTSASASTSTVNAFTPQGRSQRTN
ncbi:acetamidase/formamidase family protein [Bradyrhizobium sp. AUGA SZCCT0051]|nr:acetamidase/formamidase family protein [Bradyrhizobium sp. AUGA SZCCT0124]MBR1314661.1 acetamidase/formamidase family protein [Bradyrhizobium sp. AUGA SZCCT0051]MBR1345313.1 acetamidase/formamidase family protein [Bradyrhizobium sp. AUGA SZCCT0105]MBR1359944.1 acetamidase/formamidase family protein [Bradyrhizobium sp. AUGA SZCCT0045]